MSIVFDGTNDFANVASTPVTGVPLSILVWFKRGVTGATQRLFEINDGTTSNLFAIACQSTNIVRAIATASGTQGQADSSATITDTNTWHMALAVFAANNDRTIYVDNNAGVQNTAVRAVGAVSAIGMGVSDYQSTQANDYNGRLACVALWNSGLSSSDATALYVAGAAADPRSIVPANLKAYWDMTNPNSAGRDTVGGYNLTLNNQAAYDSDNPTIGNIIFPALYGGVANMVGGYRG